MIVTSFIVGNNKSAFFCPMRLRSLDSGRLFSANTAFRDKPFTHLYSGGFAEPFPPPLRASLRARRSSLRRAPQGLPQPLTRGRGDTPAPARLHLLWRSRAYASHTRLTAEKPTALYCFPLPAQRFFIFRCRNSNSSAAQEQGARLTTMHRRRCVFSKNPKTVSAISGCSVSQGERFATSTGRECTIVLDPPSPRFRRDKPPRHRSKARD